MRIITEGVIIYLLQLHPVSGLLCLLGRNNELNLSLPELSPNLLLPQKSLRSRWLRLQTDAGSQADRLGLEGWRRQSLPDGRQADQELLQ